MQKFIHESGAMLCDIRLSPLSRIAPWRKAQLIQRLGDSYRHIPQLGNLNYQGGGEVHLADLETGMKAVLSLLKQRPVVLMCACRDLECCHRNVVAQQLEDAELGLIIEELEL